MPFATPPMQIAFLTCERRVEPLGVDVASPHLAWTLRAEGRDRRQTGYELRVGTRPGEADLWESGRVASDESAGVLYGGKPLGSSARAFWQVRVWDEAGRASRWSAASSWTMGIVRPEDWQARWIGEDPSPLRGRGEGVRSSDSLLLRREFNVHPGLARAVVHVTGVGQFEMRLNGRKVGDDLLTPGWTDYRKTVLYGTYDVTRLLRPGSNAAGILLGNGMDNVHGPRYTKFTGSLGPQRALAQVELTYADGRSETIGTDDRWSAHPGPITYSSVYGGEDLDLRLEPNGWANAGFKGAWPGAAIVEGPGGTLRGSTSAAPPIRAIETLKPRSVRRLKPGVEVVDLGQNASIMVRMRVEGPPGSMVRVTPSELLRPDGTLDRRSVGDGPAWWQVTLDGTKATYFPKFFYHGCRYLQVETFGGAQASSIEGVVVHSSAPEVGEFACSSDLFNRIHTLVRWAQRSNLMSVITDCPHRERLGWLEQYHLNGPSLRYEHDLSTLYAKTFGDMADAQLANGLVPDIAPEFTVFGGPFRDSPEWGSAVVLAPWQQYLFHRDVDILNRYYETMKRYVAYLRSTAKDGIVSHGLGDWYDIGPGEPGPSKNTPMALTATAFYYEDVVTLAKIASILGKREDAAELTAEGESVKEAFNGRFFDPNKGYYATGSQTSSAIPLVMGLCAAEHRSAVLAQLVKDIKGRGDAVTAGDVGYRYVLRALADGDRSDLVFAMNDGSDKPGYGYQLAMGATSLTEAWDAHTTSSQNHFMLGQIVEWLYHDLCGIRPVDGFKRFAIHPSPVPGLAWARASYRSEYGLIESLWRREGAAVVYEITVPPNSSAVLELPGAKTETVGSGRHRFVVPATSLG